MYIKDNKRINIYAQYTAEDGTRYPNLTNPVLRDKLGVMEIPDPAAPEDYSDETYYRTELDTAPYIIFTKKSEEQLTQLRQSKVNAEALAYLTSTDWYVIRQQEQGTPVPQEVLLARQSARDSVKALE